MLTAADLAVKETQYQSALLNLDREYHKKARELEGRIKTLDAEERALAQRVATLRGELG